MMVAPCFMGHRLRGQYRSYYLHPGKGLYKVKGYFGYRICYPNENQTWDRVPL